MKFRKGDLVIRTDDQRGLFTEDGGNMKKVYEIVDIGIGSDILLKGMEDCRYYDDRKFKKISLNNPLNKKLYPTYIEYKGYLVPEKFTKQLKEEE